MYQNWLVTNGERNDKEMVHIRPIFEQIFYFLYIRQFSLITIGKCLIRFRSEGYERVVLYSENTDSRLSYREFEHRRIQTLPTTNAQIEYNFDK
jgi:hypothetical protein